VKYIKEHNRSIVMAKKDKALVVFQDKKIRRIWHNEEWFFSVVDVVEALTDSPNPRNYWNMLKAREAEQGIELYTYCVQLKLLAEDGKLRETDCASTKNMFRIIQSIPSHRAEPFKLWLAKVGYERVHEIQDPELAHERMIDLYRQKGYSEDWIRHRLSTMSSRHEMTAEWKKRDVSQDAEYAILTNAIIKAAFGKTVEEYKRLKRLDKQNLRDHMTGIEMLFTSLAEVSAAEIARGKDAEGFVENKTAAKEGGSVAGNARKELEKKSGRPVVSDENYLDEPEKVKRKRLR
jgi:DNA-damage-inducible protein D